MAQLPEPKELAGRVAVAGGPRERRDEASIVLSRDVVGILRPLGDGADVAARAGDEGPCPAGFGPSSLEDLCLSCYYSASIQTFCHFL